MTALIMSEIKLFFRWFFSLCVIAWPLAMAVNYNFSDNWSCKSIVSSLNNFETIISLGPEIWNALKELFILTLSFVYIWAFSHWVMWHWIVYLFDLFKYMHSVIKRHYMLLLLRLSLELFLLAEPKIDKVTHDIVSKFDTRSYSVWIYCLLNCIICRTCDPAVHLYGFDNIWTLADGQIIFETTALCQCDFCEAVKNLPIPYLHSRKIAFSIEKISTKYNIHSTKSHTFLFTAFDEEQHLLCCHVTCAVICITSLSFVTPLLWSYGTVNQIHTYAGFQTTWFLDLSHLLKNKGAYTSS